MTKVNKIPTKRSEFIVKELLKSYLREPKESFVKMEN